MATDHVSLFVTCVIDLFGPDVGAAAVRVLRGAGATVTVPDGQTCCGQPAWNSGFAKDAAAVAAQSLDALSAALDAHPGTTVVVPAGSCATMIRVFWQELFEVVGDADRAAAARRVAAATQEFSEFVAGRQDRLALGELGTSVGYHHSCHMLRELRIEAEPESLLAGAGVTQAEWASDRRCCGFGGLFSFKLPETSVAMADDKLRTLTSSGCGDIVGCDTSCLLHLEARGRHEGTPVTVRHLAQVLDDALEAGEMSAEWTLTKEPLRARTARATDDERLRASLEKAIARFGHGRSTAFATLESPEELRTAARRMRHDILSELPRIVETFADRARAAGAHVHWALDAADANAYVSAIADRLVADRRARGDTGPLGVAKGKSMATEEIGLNRILEAHGCDVVETDLGEWIIQLAGHTPSHIIAPAVHLDRFQVRDILQQAAPPEEGDIPTDPELMAKFARKMLRKRFLGAELGITGCNMAVAETGSVVLVENEGNGRLSSTVPRVHVAVMGTERIVETWDQADLVLNLLARSTSGQHLSSYTNILTGPRRHGEADGPDEFHIVILDNGRSELLGTEFEEVLNCIRCGACLNVCPVYRQVGGHAYGWVYSGPIGAVLTPLLAADLPESAEVANASSLCGACMDVCPVQIPLQDLLLGLRRRKAAEAGNAEKAAWRAWSKAWSRPLTYRASIRAMQTGRGMTRLAGMAPGLRNWSDGRDTLKPAARTFSQMWKAGEV